ncbi:MAG TPA: Uma2 family endonuclease [Planctomycetaceae bacterium]|nr:Uma2 family endonuclease [Planctomycetaceae bacterium]
MNASTASCGSAGVVVPEIPPLEPGDCLPRDEFERRYGAMPQIKMAELIEGVVHMPLPVRHDYHGNPHSALICWFATYSAATPGVSVGDNSSVRIDLDNVVQPDALLMIEAARGGQARIDADGFISGAPELVGEISATSVSIDLNAKLRVYRRNQVREYIVWRVLDRAIDWFVLRQSEFVALSPGPDGLLKSEIFPGLWLDVDALVRNELSTVLARLQEGIAGLDHAEFVAKLTAAQHPH